MYALGAPRAGPYQQHSLAPRHGDAAGPAVTGEEEEEEESV